MRIGIVGRKKDTGNYEAFLERHGVEHLTSLAISDLAACQGLLFPGGGDITPAFFGEGTGLPLHRHGTGYPAVTGV